jgi:hypothetical protein
MKMLKKIINKSVYLGELKLNNNGTMKFETPHKRNAWQRNRQFFYDLGDVVYFMFVKGELMKIGKAGGKGGWYVRANLYEAGISSRGDKTNKMIVEKLQEMGEDTITILAIQSPRITTSIKCPVLKESVEVELETATQLESVLTNKYLTEMKMSKLTFCSQ